MRIETIQNQLQDDAQAVSLLSAVMTAIVNYRDVVTAMSATLSRQRFRLEGQELRDLTQRLDTRRHQAHEVLIDAIRIANRYLFRTYGTGTIPPGGVYDGDPIHLRSLDRTAIGDWALGIAPRLTEARC